MKNGPFLPSHPIFINSKESDEYLAELRKQVFTFWREHFGMGFGRAIRLYDEYMKRFTHPTLTSFYALDSHFCEITQEPIITFIHVINKNKPLTLSNLTLTSKIIRRRS